MWRSCRRLRGLPAVLGLVLGLVAACTGSGGQQTAPTTLTATTTLAPTTTTVALPPDPQRTPVAASTVFINDWKKHDQAAAAKVAVPAAVEALFALPYANQTVILRGCQLEFVPRVCSWGPYGGGSGALYQISVSPDGANWYVSAAQVDT